MRQSFSPTALLMFCACLLVGCDHRDLQSISSVPQLRITVEDEQVITAGTPVTLQGYLPTQVSVVPTVNQAASGGGYVVQLDWSYTAPAVSPTTEWYIQWELNSFSGQDASSLEPVSLGGPRLFAETDKLEWVSNTPIAGQLYVFELSAFIIVTVNGSPGNGGAVILKKITVDLRGM